MENSYPDPVERRLTARLREAMDLLDSGSDELIQDDAGYSRYANPALVGRLRVTVGTPEENDAFLQVLADLV